MSVKSSPSCMVWCQKHQVKHKRWGRKNTVLHLADSPLIITQTTVYDMALCPEVQWENLTHLRQKRKAVWLACLWLNMVWSLQRQMQHPHTQECDPLHPGISDYRHIHTYTYMGRLRQRQRGIPHARARTLTLWLWVIDSLCIVSTSVC